MTCVDTYAPVAGGELERGGLDDGATAIKATSVRYEPVTNIFQSVRPESCSCVSGISAFHCGHEQQLVHITLESGEKLTATAGHPFRTTEGWRDAVLLKRGGKLLVHAEGEPALTTASIVDVQLETTTIAAFNLEVANAHTFFVGEDGYVVHNARSGTSGNNSASARGRSEHAKDRNGYERDVRLPGSRKRADYIDRKNKIIYELKPCNAKAVRRGNKQVKNYADTVNNANDSRWGTGWSGSVITY